MTIPQATIFAIVACTVGLFVWGRLAYDLVALLALLAGLLTGVIPAQHAFDGFSSEVVIIIGAALVVSAAIARSGVIEQVMHPILPRLRSVQSQVPVLVGAVGFLSMVCKNVGALALFMPTAMQLSRREGRTPAPLLMPMAFASLLGGIVTLIGTSPNILISQVRHDLLGKNFGMFDYTPVGLTVALLGFGFLAVFYRLVPTNRRPAGGMDAAFTRVGYTTEAMLPAESHLAGRTVAALEAEGSGAVRVEVIIREQFRRWLPAPDMVLAAGDILLMHGSPEDLETIVSRARLVLASDAVPRAAEQSQEGETSVVEGVIGGDSPLIGRTPVQAGLSDRHGVDVVAFSREGASPGRRLSALRFRQGDVLVLRGPSAAVPGALGEMRVLPLAERRIALGASKRSLLPIIVLGCAMAMAALHVLTPGVAFFGAAVVVVLLRFLTMHEAYESIEWHVLVLLGALIPVSHAVQSTGAANLVASKLLPLLETVPAPVALTAILVLTMIITPFLHNAPTVLIIGPIAGLLAQRLHLNPDAFLMAVALGAGCDFLTPIGHQCNTLVLGPGGYRFGDYARLGAPLSLLVIVVGVPMIMLVWGLGLR